MQRKIYKKASVFVMPRSSKAWQGSEALWITVAGWASAASKLYPDTYVLTTDRATDPAEVLDYPLISEQKKTNITQKRKLTYVPACFKQLIKDLVQWKISRSSKNYAYSMPVDPHNIAFIWEQHDLFPGPGRKWANQLNVPLITYVHAPQVWEAAKWGVKRPIWGRLIEYYFESVSLKKSDLVACVSSEVANKLVTMGVCSKKIIVSPMAVDPYLFNEPNNSLKLTEKFSLQGKVVIGWTGSFRDFHGLDILVDIFNIVYKQMSNSLLMLVGDGLERRKIQHRVNELGLSHAVVFAGKKPFKEIPAYISVFDIAIVSARSDKGFHYSPLKLREYLVAGKPTLAPNAGEIPETFKDEEHLLLYKIGDIKNTAKKIVDLANNNERRRSIGEAGRNYILKNGTWEVELNKALFEVGLNKLTK